MATIHSMVIASQDQATADVQRDLIAETGASLLGGLKLKDWVKQITSGMRSAVVQTKVNLVKASGTITLASLANGDTTTINGIVFTCVTTSATGPLQFNLMDTDTNAAAQAVIAYNSHTVLDGMIIASSSTTVITIQALMPGEMGNAFTIAISAHGSASAARLSGGTNGDVERTHYYGSGA